MMRQDFAESLIESLYMMFFQRSAGAGAQGYIDYLTKGGSIDFVFDELKKSDEWRAVCRAKLGFLYREILRRDPDYPGASGYLDALVKMTWTEQMVRESLLQSDEYKDKFGSGLGSIRDKKVSVVDNVLVDDTRAGHELGISLFYALARDKDTYRSVIDELASAGIEFVRFAGSTRGWTRRPPRT